MSLLCDTDSQREKFRKLPARAPSTRRLPRSWVNPHQLRPEVMVVLGLGPTEDLCSCWWPWVLREKDTVWLASLKRWEAKKFPFERKFSIKIQHNFDAESDGCPAIWNPSHGRGFQSNWGVPMLVPCRPGTHCSCWVHSSCPYGFGINAGFLGYPLTGLGFLLKKLTKPENKRKINQCRLLGVDMWENNAHQLQIRAKRRSLFCTNNIKTTIMALKIENSL